MNVAADAVRPGVFGYCARPFEEVRAVLDAQVTSGEHRGFAVAAFHKGRLVVDLWGGYNERAPDGWWAEDSMTVALSAGKSIINIVFVQALERAGVSWDAPITDIWPEFGERRATIAHLLSQRAGVPHARAIVDRLSAMADWDHMTRGIAALEALWEPGTRQGYHALTYGWIVGELASRLEGRPFHDLVRDLVERLELDGCWFGVPEADRHRVAKTLPPEAAGRFKAPEQIVGRSLFKQAFIEPDELFEFVNSDEGLAAGAPSFGGAFTARSLASVYLLLQHNGVRGDDRVLSPDAVRRMATPAGNRALDLVLMYPIAWTFGFMHRAGARALGKAAFGLAGFGGSLGFADPEAELAFGLVCSQGDETGFGARRNDAVLAALYGALR